MIGWQALYHCLSPWLFWLECMSSKGPPIKALLSRWWHWEALWTFKRWSLAGSHRLLEVCPWKALCNVGLFSLTLLCCQVPDVMLYSVTCSCHNVSCSPQAHHMVLPDTGTEPWELWASFLSDLFHYAGSHILIDIFFPQVACAQIFILLSMCSFYSLLRSWQHQHCLGLC